MRLITPLFIFLMLVSCQPQNRGNESQRAYVAEVVKDPAKIYNLMNEELPKKALPDSLRMIYEANLLSAKEAYDKNPDSLELIIWHGRRLAYLGRYLEAIEVYSDGLTIYPHAHQLFRHRGHRFITTRQLKSAIKDFEMAAYYSINAPNNTEPDGIPNHLNKPLSNDKFNIWYHFGLAYYLNGRYDKALSAYNKCMEFSDNPDLKVATTYWQYLTYKKLGNSDMAEKTLEDISASMKLIENNAYLDLILLFKGKKDVKQLMRKATDEDGVLNPTMGYGIGSYYQHQGRFEKANEVFLNVLESSTWDAFGYIATEAELKAAFPVP